MTDTFDYAGPYGSLEKAQIALEDCYATGDIVDGERPQIEMRKVQVQNHKERRYWITLTYAH